MKFENTIICGDCLEVMKDWPDNCVDLVLTDPPYGLNIKYDKYDDSNSNLKKNAQKWIDEWRRVGNAVVFAPGVQNIWIYPPSDWIFCWNYYPGHTYGKWGFSSWQPILAYGKDPFLHSGMGCRDDMIIIQSANDRDDGHPCQKSLKVWIEFVKRFSPHKNDIILDPMAGSFTTCVAAKMLGRRYIGIDISPEYCQIAEERLRAVDTGVPVKEARAGQGALFE